MKKKDWFFKDDHSICSFRSVGVLLRNNKILVQCDKGEYALPGGHIAFGETSNETLIREYKEETGADIVCNRLIWIEETFWKWDSRDAHSIAFYYLISLKNDADIPDDAFFSQKDNCNIMLKWVTIEEMKQLTIYPSFLKNKIENISDGIEHFVSLG